MSFNFGALLNQANSPFIFFLRNKIMNKDNRVIPKVICHLQADTGLPDGEL